MRILFSSRPAYGHVYPLMPHPVEVIEPLLAATASHPVHAVR